MRKTLSRPLLPAVLLALSQGAIARGFPDGPVIHTPPLQMTGREGSSPLDRPVTPAPRTPAEPSAPAIRTAPLKMIGRRCKDADAAETDSYSARLSARLVGYRGLGNRPGAERSAEAGEPAPGNRPCQDGLPDLSGRDPVAQPRKRHGDRADRFPQWHPGHQHPRVRVNLSPEHRGILPTHYTCRLLLLAPGAPRPGKCPGQMPPTRPCCPHPTPSSQGTRGKYGSGREVDIH